MFLTVPIQPLNVTYNSVEERPFILVMPFNPNATYTAWSADQDYLVGWKVRYTPPGELYPRTFEATQDHSDQAPRIGGSSYWIDLGINNRWRMFDGLNNSRTVSTDEENGDIEVHVELDRRANVLYLFGLRNVYEVSVLQKVDGSYVSNQLVNLSTTLSPVGWWSWLYGERDYVTSCAIPLIGNYLDQTVEVFMRGSGFAECAQLMLGKSRDIGHTEQGAGPRLQSFSTFAPDEFGVYNYVKRGNTRVGSYTVTTPINEFDRVFRLVERLEGDLVILDANNEGTSFDSIRHYGKIVDFSPSLSYEDSAYDIKIEGIN